MIWFALVVLPEDRDKAAEFITKLLLEPVVIAPLLVMVPVAFKVKLPAPEMVAPVATVRFPATSTVTLEVLNAVEIAAAVELSTTKSVGSKSHIPLFPLGAETSTTAVVAITKVPVDDVSM